MRYLPLESTSRNQYRIVVGWLVSSAKSAKSINIASNIAKVFSKTMQDKGAAMEKKRSYYKLVPLISVL